MDDQGIEGFPTMYHSLKSVRGPYTGFIPKLELGTLDCNCNCNWTATLNLERKLSPTVSVQRSYLLGLGFKSPPIVPPRTA